MSTQSPRAATSQANGVDERLVLGVLDRVYAASPANSN
jgi:hypothetical protein